MRMRRLPDPAPPARHEIPASYISRLATLHGLDINDLWVQVTEREESGGLRRVVIPERLAALTGRSLHDLAGALPELRDPPPDWAMFRHQPQTGCQLCDAKHPGGKVTRLLPHHRYVCTRHRRWIGPPDIDRPAADLGEIPAVVHAQQQHLRILRQHGWAATYDAVLTAFTFCGHIWSGVSPPQDPGHVWHTWDARARVLVPPGEEWSTFSTSKLFAAVYPEAVRLAAMIASPFWRHLASGTPGERRQFDREISRRVSYSYDNTPEYGDAIAHWAHADSWRPPAQPRANYSPSRTKGALSPIHGGSIRRHENSALWFGRTRKAGSTLLHHSHVKPVLLRPWRPDYEQIKGAIWHSTRTDADLQSETARERAAQGSPTSLPLPPQRSSPPAVSDGARPSAR
ncbi:hypothetical protein [Streptantibioticus ferralitis]|uniref:TniQ protein n=1 Tax=Streptantibioticus ferralitis TaxID=236510 RepID=A0ABT5YSL8_9ACTN|nr:hypothetical protein [Streptantibioticus ferralitis]MDF2254549.1 hypothetical protein [Streptantibioticus ferralitis]